jgi:hypothetical protein
MMQSASCLIGRGRRLAVAGVVIAATFVFFATFASAAFAGNLFATGHDQDLHCSDSDPNECAYYQITTTFVRAGSNLPVLILDRGGLEAVAALNLAYSNNQSRTPTPSSPPYVVEDPQAANATQINGAPPPGIATSSTWPTTPLVDSGGHPLWSAIIVASDASCGGCDLNSTGTGHPDSDAINARTADIQAFFNAGGGLLYLAGADNAFNADGVMGKDVYYASVPVPIGGQPVTEPFTVTPDGASLGITNTMANCCATHNSFSLPPAGSAIKVAETDNAGLAESLLVQNGNVCTSGFCLTTGAPASVSTGPPTVAAGGTAAFTGSLNPNNLPTTAHFEYGLDPSLRGPGESASLYDQSTPEQAVGADFSVHQVFASVSGLVPNALYHVRMVATNGAGTIFGPDQTFRTAQDPAPPRPVLGTAVDVSVVSGQVFILPPPGQSLAPAGDPAASAALSKGQGFVPLTEARQIPTGSEIDSLNGSLKIVTATGHLGKTQTATLAGGVYKVTQARAGITKGLTTFSLQEAAFQGAPTYATCKAKTKTKKAADSATIASSSRTLQLMHASAKGNFRTTGRYGSATVRGTIWTIADRCDGTLTHVIRDTVLVNDFARHKTILLHAGQSYLAKAILRRK